MFKNINFIKKIINKIFYILYIIKKIYQIFYKIYIRLKKKKIDLFRYL